MHPPRQDAEGLGVHAVIHSGGRLPQAPYHQAGLLVRLELVARHETVVDREGVRTEAVELHLPKRRDHFLLHFLVVLNHKTRKIAKKKSNQNSKIPGYSTGNTGISGTAKSSNRGTAENCGVAKY